jgi:hypothetical protein
MSVAFAGLLAFRLVMMFRARRKLGDEAVDAIASVVAAARALAARHVYLSALLPCHAFCGPLHAVSAFVHVIAIFYAAATILNTFPALTNSDGVRGEAIVAAGATIVASAISAVLGVPLRMYALNDARRAEADASEGYIPTDLAKYGVGKCDDLVGVSAKTLDASDAVLWTADEKDTQPATAMGIFDIEGPESNTLQAAATECNFAELNEMIECSAMNAAFDDSDDSDEKGAAASASATPHNDDGVDAFFGEGTFGKPQPLADEDSYTPSAVTESGSAGESASSTAGARHPQTHVVVDCRSYRAIGLGSAAVLGGLCLVLFIDAASGWCQPERARFNTALGMGVAMDVLAIQPALGLLALAFEWLADDSADEDEQDDDDEAGLTAEEIAQRKAPWYAKRRFELHPVHGQWRFVGLLAGVPDVERD